MVLLGTAFNPRITMTSLRTNHHFAWMIPLCSLVLFSAVGLVLSAAARAVPKSASRLAWRLFPALAALSLLLAAEGLRPSARLVLACGVGISAGVLIERRPARFIRLAHAGVTMLGGALVVLAVAWAACVACAEGWRLSHLPAAAPGAPNVLLIVLDTVRADSLSAFGHDRPTTPNLERLASQGVRFSHARSTAPWTLPSHASMFTGQWCHDLSVSWDRALDSADPTIAEYLAERGYATAGFVGNAYYCNARYGLARGFAHYEDFYENRVVSPYEVVRSTGLGRSLLVSLGYKIKLADWGTVRRKTAESINRDALEWMAGRPDGRPFFVFLNYNDAHAPYLVPEGPAPRFGLATLGAESRAVIYQKFRRLATGKARPEDGPIEQVDREGTALLRDSYESCIAYIDRQIGLLFDDLERRGLRDNTVVIVTADHGEHFQERGFHGHGLSLYRKEVHVPLLILPPAGRSPVRPVVDEPVSLRNLPATIADLVGAGSSAPFPGRSLAGLWNSPRRASGIMPDYVLSEVEQQRKYQPNSKLPATMSPVQALVAEGKVYIRSGDLREELYDLEADPHETHDLIGSASEQSLVARCRSALSSILAGEQTAATAALAQTQQEPVDTKR
ncbi:MAG: sulfatase [Isosphaeraceae bacterium]|nr:sulfatase [Isosphaeraceae bacterium]